jgi:4'-phosphopantetheinyl transferase
MPQCAASEIRIAVANCGDSLSEWVPRAQLAENEIQVWHACTRYGGADLSYLRGCLADDEICRAERFRFAKDRDQFITCRGLLRILLGSYTGAGPRGIQFEYSGHGKPALAPDFGGKGVCFNVAHSGERVVLAFTHGRRIGIDIEKIRHDLDTRQIAERFFSIAERECLRQLSVEQQRDAFFRCWTRKEAFVKATGDGLSLPLSQFDVAFAPGAPARLIQTRPVAAEARHWFMEELSIHPDYAGAIVAELSPCGVTE